MECLGHKNGSRWRTRRHCRRLCNSAALQHEIPPASEKQPAGHVFHREIDPQPADAGTTCCMASWSHCPKTVCPIWGQHRREDLKNQAIVQPYNLQPYPRHSMIRCTYDSDIYIGVVWGVIPFMECLGIWTIHWGCQCYCFEHGYTTLDIGDKPWKRTGTWYLRNLVPPSTTKAPFLRFDELWADKTLGQDILNQWEKVDHGQSTNRHDAWNRLYTANNILHIGHRDTGAHSGPIRHISLSTPGTRI